jgi:hypothetical protein
MFTFTDMAVDYSVDELDDLTDRKVAPEGIDGDRLARIIRARRGTARATGQADPYAQVENIANVVVWDGTRQGTPRTGSNRRMAAVGEARTRADGAVITVSETGVRQFSYGLEEDRPWRVAVAGFEFRGPGAPGNRK